MSTDRQDVLTRLTGRRAARVESDSLTSKSAKVTDFFPLPISLASREAFQARGLGVVDRSPVLEAPRAPREAPPFDARHGFGLVDRPWK
jgi:hypothetical protein